MIFDNPDGGYVGPEGIPVFDEDQPSSNITVRRNDAVANNSLCFPLGPEVELGGTGILINGQKIKVIDNVASHNVADGPSGSAAGILVTNNQDQPVVDRVLLRATRF